MKRCFCVATILGIGLAGCFSPQARMQSSEESEREKDLEIHTVGSVTEVANVTPARVSAVGLVTNLNGTGHSPPGSYRTMLEKYLRQNRIENPKALLDSADNALVLVSALIPPGARKGDLIDVEVTLPPGSKATSLHGGYLQLCELRDFNTTHGINPDYQGADRMLMGHVHAKAKGNLLVGMSAPGEPSETRRGRIWQGAVCLDSRPFYLVLKKDDQSARVANAVAERINVMFRDDPRKQQAIMQNRDLFLLSEVTDQLNQAKEPMANGDVAKALNKEIINVRVPYAYRFNPERYLRVARLMPLREVPEQQARYRRRLQKMLLDPADTIRAALRLEALGKESIPALKAGLSSDHALVRFASAEALTYLGSTAGVPELAELAKDRERVEWRNFCLLALAGLDESVCRSKLEEMLSLDDVELRCGAFVALRRLQDSYFTENYYQECLRKKAKYALPLGAERLGGTFWLHHVAPDSPDLVYFAVERRSEVVLFGDNIQLVTPVRLLVGPEFTVTAETGDDRVTVSRITTEGMQQRLCSLRLDEVLRTIAAMGGQYPEAVDLLRKLDDRRGLNCRIGVNCLPHAVSVDALAEQGINPSHLSASR